MSYKKAEMILPEEIIELIQQYVDGECIYIPRKKEKQRAWGMNTNIRQELQIRNMEIYEDYQNGISVQNLSEKYYLSTKSIQRILLQEKKKSA